MGGVSLGLEQLLAVDSDAAALDFLVDNGAEAAFQAGMSFTSQRLILVIA